VHYGAFISYSRDVDGKLAPALQIALQRFAKPWYRKRALRVFRDDASLSANPDLWGSIQMALDASEFFVLLASPAAAASPWVEKEVAYWLDHKPQERLLLVLTAGTIAADGAGGQPSDENSLPEALREALRAEPRYTDLTWARTEEHLARTDPRFRAAVADIAAPLHGIPKDELIGEDVRQHRRTIRLAFSAAVALVTLLALASLTALFAVDQRNDARAERDTATSRALAAEAADQDVPVSLLMSLEALRIRNTVDARGALLAALQRPSPEAVAYLQGPRDIVFSVALSPDGKLLAAGNRDGSILLWDVEHRRQSGEPLRGDSSASVVSVAFSPDGKTLAAGSADRTIILWDVPGHRRRGAPLLGHRNYVTSVSFSPDGKTLASADLDRKSILLWDVERQRLSGTLTTDDESVGLGWRVVFSPDGSKIASAGNSSNVTVWDLGKRRVISTFEHRSLISIECVAFSPDGTLLAAGGDAVDEGPIVLWNMASRRAWRLRGHKDAVKTLAFSPDGKTLASGSADRTIIVWDVESRKARGAPLQGHGDEVLSVAFGPGGKTLASGSEDTTVILWDLGRRSRLGASFGSSWARALDLSPDGRLLASADGRAIVLWDVGRLRRVGAAFLAHRGDVNSVAFSPDGKTIASGSKDKTVILWHVKTHRPKGAPLVGHSDFVHAVAFSPDGKMLASGGSDNVVILWDVETHRRLATLHHSDQIVSVAFSPDGKTLAAGSADHTLILWDVESRQRLGEPLGGHERWVEDLDFSPDGKTLASAAFEVILWDLEKRRQIESPLGRDLGGVSFSPDGKTLAFGSHEGPVILWDIESRRRIGALMGHRDWVTALAFIPDGEALVSASLDKTMTRWNVSLPSWKKFACTLANRNLSHAEWTRLIGAGSYRRTCPNLPSG